MLFSLSVSNKHSVMTLTIAYTLNNLTNNKTAMIHSACVADMHDSLNHAAC